MHAHLLTAILSKACTCMIGSRLSSSSTVLPWCPFDRGGWWPITIFQAALEACSFLSRLLSCALQSWLFRPPAGSNHSLCLNWQHNC